MALPLFYLVGRYNYNLFHSFADGVSIVIAVCAFTIVWNSRRLADNNYFLYTGIAFLFFALLDAIHVLGNKGMGVFPHYGNLGPTLYVAGSYVLSISLLIAPLFVNRRLNSVLVFGAYSVATSLILLSVFYWRVFPACIVEGVGLTPFKMISDYVICLILLGAVGLLLINRRFFDPRVLRLIVSSLVMSIASGLAFALYLDPFGITNMVGHLFQIASFYLIYLAFIETSVTKPQEILFRKLKQNEEKLISTNAELQQEVSERKRVEWALRKSRDELEIRVEERTSQLRESEETALRQKREIDAYYDASPAGLGVLDGNLRYVRINQRLADINGRAASEHIGRSVEELLPPSLANTIGPALRRVMETGEPIRGMELTDSASELSGLKKTWLQTINPLRDTMGQVIRVTVAVQDITGLRQLEERLRQAQKMEALGTLTGGIAHDFNNILAGIIGFTEMSLDDELPDDSPLRHHLELVLKGGFRARDLIKQMLTFSRKTEYETKPLALTPLVKETVKLLRASIPTTINIDVNATAASDSVLANATGIQQIIMNLAANAAYAMRENGGKLIITLADADGAGAGLRQEACLELAVQDTGTGMDGEVMKRIFEPFFTTKAVGDGTGMGLAVVYGIVRSFNGDISVESTPGVGSTFRVLLPKAAADEGSESIGSGKVPGGKEHVLFIDDEEMITELGAGILERFGYTVTALTDSLEALRLFSADPSRFDLIITDQTMPNLTGMRLAERVLEIRPDMPVILCTGHSETVDPAATAAAGIREFLMKPLARRELAEAVRRVLDTAGSA